MASDQEKTEKRRGVALKACLKVGLFLLPFFLCSAGFLISGYPITNALYAGVQSYILQLGAADDPNLLVEVGRWLAPVAISVLGISALVAVVQGRLKNFLCVRLFGSTVVYGDGDLIERYCNPSVTDGRGMVPRYVAPGNDYIMKADKYVLLFHDDAEAMRFYSEELDDYTRGNDNARVYIELTNLKAESVGADKTVHTFCLEDYVSRRLFTQERWVSRCSSIVGRRAGHSLKIALIGRGRDLEAALEAALMLCLYDFRQHITYYVFGLSEEYRMLHSGIFERGRLHGDRIVAAGDKWQSPDSRETISGCDAVVLCGDHADNVVTAADLVRTCSFFRPDGGKFGPAEIYVLGVSEDAVSLLRQEIDRVAESMWKKGKEPAKTVELVSFGAPDSPDSGHGFTLDDVIEDTEKGYRTADEHHSGGRERGTLGEDGPFKYWSTVVRDYYVRVVGILARRAVDTSVKGGAPVFDRGTCDDFARLEHERWCRYHFLNNWMPCETEGERNDALHKHNDLRPWEDLDSDKIRAYDYKPLFFALLDMGLDPDEYVDKGACDRVEKIYPFRSNK